MEQGTVEALAIAPMAEADVRLLDVIPIGAAVRPGAPLA